MEAQLVKSPSLDLLVVNAARVSFGKFKTEFDDGDEKLIKYLAEHNHKSPFFHPHVTVRIDEETMEKMLPDLITEKELLAGMYITKHYQDEGYVYWIVASVYAWWDFLEIWENPALVKFLHEKAPVSSKYLSRPTGMMGSFGILDAYVSPDVYTLHMKAPLFVKNQLITHRVGLPWNEISRRYVDYVPELYTPNEWRLRHDNKKQGSSDELYEHSIYPASYVQDINSYTWLIEQGICPEQARMVLPVASYTEWYWTGHKNMWQRVFDLRLKPDAQKETRDLVAQMKEIIETEHLFG